MSKPILNLYGEILKNCNVLIAISTMLFATACQTSDSFASENITQSEAEIANCLRAIMQLEEGTWAYMGTIAQSKGKFRTFETTSERTILGPDMWKSRSYGGDITGTGGQGETSKIVGASIISIEDGILQEDSAIKYTSCVGPDAQGRYESWKEYELEPMNGKKVYAKALQWHSEHGSYFAEDIFDESGYTFARRSGVYTPIDE